MKLKFLKKSLKKEIFMVNYNNKKKILVRRMALKQHKEIDDDWEHVILMFDKEDTKKEEQQ